MLRVVFLLAERLGECCDPRNNANGHEYKRNYDPNDTPALGGPAVSVGKYAGIRGVDFTKNQVVTLNH